MTAHPAPTDWHRSLLWLRALEMALGLVSMLPVEMDLIFAGYRSPWGA